MIRCPHCNGRVVQKSQDGKVRIRTNIVAFGPGGAEINCKQCGNPVLIDLQLGETLRKALDHGPRLVIRKVVDAPNSGQ